MDKTCDNCGKYEKCRNSSSKFRCHLGSAWALIEIEPIQYAVSVCMIRQGDDGHIKNALVNVTVTPAEGEDHEQTLIDKMTKMYKESYPDFKVEQVLILKMEK